jgi:hypothetical protein
MNTNFTAVNFILHILLQMLILFKVEGELMFYVSSLFCMYVVFFIVCKQQRLDGLLMTGKSLLSLPRTVRAEVLP